MLASTTGLVNIFSGATTSQADLDDRPLLDLLEPGSQACLVLLPEEEIADLLAGALQPLALQRLLRFQLEEMVSEGGPVGLRDLPRRQLEDLVLDEVHISKSVLGPSTTLALF